MTTQPIDLDHLPVDEYNSLPFKFDEIGRAHV